MQPALVAMVTTHSVTAHCRKYLLISYVRVKVYSKQRLAMLHLHTTITYAHTHTHTQGDVATSSKVPDTDANILGSAGAQHTPYTSTAEWCQ